MSAEEPEFIPKEKLTAEPKQEQHSVEEEEEAKDLFHLSSSLPEVAAVSSKVRIPTELRPCNSLFKVHSSVVVKTEFIETETRPRLSGNEIIGTFHIDLKNPHSR